MQESETNPDNCFHCIVTSDAIWVYYDEPLSQQEAKVLKKPDEETSTRFRRTRLTEKVMMVIFWEKYDILLSEYLPGGIAISGSYYASIIERLRCAIVEKCRGKVSDGVLLLHDNAPVHKCNIVLATIRKAGFVELNHPVYSPDIAPSDYYLFSNLKKFFSWQEF